MITCGLPEKYWEMGMSADDSRAWGDRKRDSGRAHLFHPT